MISDTQLVFRGLDHSDAVEEAVQKRADKLERFSDQIQSLRVTVESPHNNHHKGKVYHVGVEAIIPNHDIVVNHDQHDNHAHEDIYVAIRDSFDAVERQIKDINEKKRKLSRTSAKLAESPLLMPEAADNTELADVESMDSELAIGINNDIVTVDDYGSARAANE